MAAENSPYHQPTIPGLDALGPEGAQHPPQEPELNAPGIQQRLDAIAGAVGRLTSALMPPGRIGEQQIPGLDRPPKSSEHWLPDYHPVLDAPEMIVEWTDPKTGKPQIASPLLGDAKHTTIGDDGRPETRKVPIYGEGASKLAEIQRFRRRPLRAVGVTPDGRPRATVPIGVNRIPIVEPITADAVQARADAILNRQQAFIRNNKAHEQADKHGKKHTVWKKRKQPLPEETLLYTEARSPGPWRKKNILLKPWAVRPEKPRIPS